MTHGRAQTGDLFVGKEFVCWFRWCLEGFFEVYCLFFSCCFFVGVFRRVSWGFSWGFLWVFPWVFLCRSSLKFSFKGFLRFLGVFSYPRGLCFLECSSICWKVSVFVRPHADCCRQQGTTGVLFIRRSQWDYFAHGWWFVAYDGHQGFDQITLAYIPAVHCVFSSLSSLQSWWRALRFCDGWFKCVCFSSERVPRILG